jgi:hypothetical protein
MNLFMCIQSMIVTSLYLHSLVYIFLQLFWFSQFLVVLFFEILYGTEAVVCQNILKTSVQYPAVILLWEC